MTSPREALEIAYAFSTIRSFSTLATVGHRMTWRRSAELAREEASARLRLTKLLPSVAVRRPENAVDAANLQDEVVAHVVSSMDPGGLAERALGLGVAFVEVVVAASVADLLDLVLAEDQKIPRFVKRFEDTMQLFESARETFARASDRFEQGLDPELTSRVAKERVVALRRVASRGWCRETWLESIRAAILELMVAVEFPPERPRPIDPSYPWDEERALLAQILARPLDDAVRLKWAELVDGRDQARATLVRAQLALRDTTRKIGIWLGESALTKHLLENHPEWADDVRALGADASVFHGGFVEDVTIRARVFVDNGAALLATAPLRRLRLTEVAPDLDALLASGLLGRLQWLDLSGQKLDDSQLEAILRIPDLKRLRGISLESNRITNRGVRALWTSPLAKSLTFFGLDGNPCSDLLTQELSPQEMSVYEWVPTEFALQLETELGPRTWSPRSPAHLELLTLRD